MHGDLSPEVVSLDQIRRLQRPTDIPDSGILCDLLCSDPEPGIKGWGENDRGVSFTFGADIVKSFLEKHDLDFICRAHQVVQDGYEFLAAASTYAQCWRGAVLKISELAGRWASQRRMLWRTVGFLAVPLQRQNFQTPGCFRPRSPRGGRRAFGTSFVGGPSVLARCARGCAAVVCRGVRLPRSSTGR